MGAKNDCGIWEKTKECLVPLDRLATFPLYHRETIPVDYLDAKGHMNVRWYMALFDTAIWKFFLAHGLDENYFTRENMGVFALKHFIQYFSEVRAGETVAMRINTEKYFQVVKEVG